ncbi:amidohydrolase family protein [Thermoproteota archaeon]
MVDIIITGGTIISMNDEREVITDGGIAVDSDRIIEVGSRKEIEKKYKANKIINAENHAVLPGLIDTHGHAGHSMMKTIGETYDQWGTLIEDVYLRGVPEVFWYYDSVLAALEKIKFGVTTSASFLGGGRGAYRTDDPRYAEDYSKGAVKIGVRNIIGLGPIGRAPYTPREFHSIRKGKKESKVVDFAGMLETTRKIVEKYDDFDNLVTARVTVSTISPNLNDLSKQDVQTVKDQAEEIKELADSSGRGILAHGGGGTIESAKELGLLGPKVILAHCGGLSQDEINILRETGTHVSHCPRARAIMRRRCPVVELLDSGVNVALGTDGSSPDRTFDMFSDMKVAQTLQRHYFHDPRYMPPGKVLEMATVDAARGLNLERQIGSLEAGKKADIILVNLKKAHLTPNFMIPHRIVYEAYGQDVDTAIVDGKVIMENSKILTINEVEALNKIQEIAEEVVEINDLRKYMGLPKGFWGSSRYLE